MKILAEKIDDLGRLQCQQDRAENEHAVACAVRLARIEAIEQELLGACADKPADKAVSFVGAKYVANVTAKGNQTEIINVAAAIRKVGIEHATIQLGVLRVLLPKHEHDEYMKTERTGPRKIQTSAKAA